MFDMFDVGSELGQVGGLRLTPYTYAKLVKYTSTNSFENPNILRSYVYGTNKGVYRSSVQRY